MLLTIFVAAYVTVLLTELAGDKAIYTISALATRYGGVPVLSGIIPAFAVKMLGAVLLGRVIAELPARVVAAISAATLLGTAALLWFRDPSAVDAREQTPSGSARGATVSFGALMLSEWSDAGQIAAAALTARYGAPGVVWAAGTLALATKGAIAVALGLGLRRYVSRTTLRYGAVTLCAVMGVLAAVEVLGT
ncbi:MAG TPA: TMEM165/GDT1 family protein [Gemmatimonadaceae bacterium]|nr:TMEM165/GDT1 family protein [Gemmatimonadaceae bacterium]